MNKDIHAMAGLTNRPTNQLRINDGSISNGADKQRWTELDRQAAVDRVSTLTDNGFTKSKARMRVAQEYAMSVSGIINWEKTVELDRQRGDDAQPTTLEKLGEACASQAIQIHERDIAIKTLEEEVASLTHALSEVRDQVLKTMRAASSTSDCIDHYLGLDQDLPF